MYNVGISVDGRSYTPEAYAYKSYLEKNGINVELVPPEGMDSSFDAHIYFMGLLPFWKSKGDWLEVHEYQSLSTPRFARFKDKAKKIINRIPDRRIYLNDAVNHRLGFSDNIDFILRDMGVEDELFQIRNESPICDIIYAGSLRIGLFEELIRLVRLNLQILVVGYFPEVFRIPFDRYRNISFIGRVDRQELPKLFASARFGLNYMPDIYPYNIQTSTKVLEYLASGLGVISSRYSWIDKFSEIHGFKVLYLDEIRVRDDIEGFDINDVDVSKYRWSTILSNANFKTFISGG